MYKLMIPEMRVLQAGYEIASQEAEDHQRGVSSGQRGAFSEFAQELDEGSWHNKHQVRT